MMKAPRSQGNPMAAVAFVVGVVALAAYVVAWLPWYERQQPVSPDEQRELDQQLAVTTQQRNMLMGRE